MDKAQFRAASRQVQENVRKSCETAAGDESDAVAGLKPEADENFFDVITRAKNELTSPKSEIWG